MTIDVIRRYVYEINTVLSANILFFISLAQTLSVVTNSRDLPMSTVTNELVPI